MILSSSWLFVPQRCLRKPPLRIYARLRRLATVTPSTGVTLVAAVATTIVVVADSRIAHDAHDRDAQVCPGDGRVDVHPR
jgi:hypothetical protein